MTTLKKVFGVINIYYVYYACYHNADLSYQDPEVIEWCKGHDPIKANNPEWVTVRLSELYALIFGGLDTGDVEKFLAGGPAWFSGLEIENGNILYLKDRSYSDTVLEDFVKEHT